MLLNPVLTTGTLTYQHIEDACLQTLLDPAAQQGEMTTLYQPLILRATDDVARSCDAWWATDILDLTANHAEYCGPRLYRIKTARIQDSQGAWRSLPMLSRERAVAILGANYEQRTPNDPPQYAVLSRPGDVGGALRLVPAPLVSRNNALEMEGFAAPGRYWAYSGGVPQTLASSTPYPLAEWTMDAVVFRACLLRCVQMATNEHFALRLPLMERLYRDQLGLVRRKAIRWYDQRSL